MEPVPGARSGFAALSAVAESFDELLELRPRTMVRAFAPQRDLSDEDFERSAGAAVRTAVCQQLESLNLRYERGDSPSELAKWWSFEWNTFAALQEHKKITHTEAGFALDCDFTNLSTLAKEIATLSWSLLLKIPKVELARFNEWFPGGADLSYDSLVASVVPGRVIADGPGVERPYRLLAEVWTCPVEEREARLGKFVDFWRPGTKEALGIAPNSDQSGLFGNWNVEAAATAVVLGIDDSSFRDHPHYPAELADHGRKNWSG